MKALSKKTNQWLWFIGLWFAGFTTMGLIAYALKLLIKTMQ